MNHYYLGVDIGATKSHALIADETGQTLGFGEAGPGNHEVVGYDGLIGALKLCIGAALKMAGISLEDIRGAGFGIAGYDWPGELLATTEAISHIGIKSPFEIVNDTIIGLVAGAEKGWGIGLVSGTGCNCWGWDENHNIGRVTGMGGWFGEFAGGGDIVQKAITAVAYEAFCRGPQTELSKVFYDLTGAQNTLELLEGLTLEQYTIDARAAPLVIQAAYKGDQVAVDILRWAGQELAELACCVARQIGLEQREFDIVLIGSIFNCGELLLNPLKKTVHQSAPYARFVRLNSPPVVGGVLIGMSKERPPSPEVRLRLIQTAKDYLPQTRSS